MNSGITNYLNFVISDDFKVSSAFQDIITVRYSKFNKHIISERDLMIKNFAVLNLNNSFCINSPQNPWMIKGISTYYQTKFLNSGLLDKSEESSDLLSIQDKIKTYLMIACTK